jgi:hypothetical protein
MAVLVGVALARWVAESCLAQGVPVKVSDDRALDKVRTLLCAGSPVPERGVSAAGTASRRSKAPHGRDPSGVQLLGTMGAGADDGVIEDGVDDGPLPPEVEGRPLAS